jgi:hypothetical protein
MRRKYSALILLTIVAAAGCTSSQAPNPAKPAAKTSNSVSAATTSCFSSITPRSLPTWARAGFRPPTMPMPYVVGDRGDIVAILWADHDPLHAPPLAQPNNKILWVSKLIPVGPFTPLRIQATLDGTSQIVIRQVPGGPGPSIINLPAAGCWSLNLSWSGHHDHLNLRYSAS